MLPERGVLLRRRAWLSQSAAAARSSFPRRLSRVAWFDVAALSCDLCRVRLDAFPLARSTPACALRSAPKTRHDLTNDRRRGSFRDRSDSHRASLAGWHNQSSLAACSESTVG